MIKENQQLLNRLNALSDGLIIFLMIPVSFWLRYQVLPNASVNMSLRNYMIIGFFYTVLQIVVFFAVGVYRPFRHARLRRKLSEMLVAFLIGLGVWFPVTTSTMNGVQNVQKNFYEAAETLGTKKFGILMRVVVPASMPSIFTGLTQGMSIACLTLVVAEMMGVEAGLGWYINWQKGWGDFTKMYGAIILICLTFIAVNTILGFIKKRVLRWQDGGI